MAKTPETIRIDPDAYSILEKCRKTLIDAGRPGASFSDTIRELDNIRVECISLRQVSTALQGLKP